jgi:hypothetical protein
MADVKKDFKAERAGSMALHVLAKDDQPLELILDWHGVGQFFRIDGGWSLEPKDSDNLDDSKIVYINPERSIEFIDKWDTEDSELDTDYVAYTATREQLVTMYPEYANASEVENAVVAAGNFTCPPATQDIMINLENRNKAIKSAGYGPLNPDRPNVDFWEEKAELWSTTVDEAKSSRCGNCAVFIRTPEMLDCLDSGLTQEGSKEAWDAIDAGTLGYCEAFDFKCAAGRTCVAWVAGGPVTGKDKDN